jgi:phosphatidylethanolamine/phosphatidyl-N-methylethanolamine N-methyltransferase
MASRLLQSRLTRVEATYERLAPVYDVIYGPLLQHGRRRGLWRLAPRPGESILELGVGTGLSALQYPPGCRVVAIDVSAPMLERARTRLRKHQIDHVRLCRMNAERLAFGDASFDAVYAPYVMNVVPDPVAVAREMLRVCRRQGRLVFLNHFDRASATLPMLDRFLGRVASGLSGARWHLDLSDLLDQSGLEAVSVDRVNIPPVSSVVVCRRRERDASR